MTANTKVLLLLAGLAVFNVAVFVAKWELHRTLSPILKALGS